MSEEKCDHKDQKLILRIPSFAPFDNDMLVYQCTSCKDVITAEVNR